MSRKVFHPKIVQAARQGFAGYVPSSRDTWTDVEKRAKKIALEMSLRLKMTLRAQCLFALSTAICGATRVGKRPLGVWTSSPGCLSDGIWMRIMG